MSADVLRRAATILRERAEAAPRGPWRPIGSGTVGHPLTERMFGTVADTYPTGGSAEQVACTDYIATIHPGVGLALADWLDDEALMVETRKRITNSAALEVGRLIVGGES